MGEIGSGDGTTFPAALDTNAVPEVSTDFVRLKWGNDVEAMIAAIEAAIGVNPEGDYATIVARLNKFPKPLDIDVAAVGNVGAGEDDLITYAMPANKLTTAGDTIRVKAWGTFAANANTKTVKLYFGATAVVTAGPWAFNGLTWVIDATITMTGAGAQDAIGEYRQSAAGGAVTVTTPAEDETGIITIKCTGEGTANDDIKQEGMISELLPVP